MPTCVPLSGQEIFEVADLDGDTTLRSLLPVLIEHFPDIQPNLFNSNERSFARCADLCQRTQSAPLKDGRGYAA